MVRLITAQVQLGASTEGEFDRPLAALNKSSVQRSQKSEGRRKFDTCISRYVTEIIGKPPIE